MSIIQGVIASIGSAPPPPPTPDVIDALYSSDNDAWYCLSTNIGGGTKNATGATAYTYPGGASGSVLNFTNNGEYFISPGLSLGNSTWQSNSITIDIWFYPTAYGTQLMSELGSADINSGYHYSVFEIDGSGHVWAHYYNGTAIMSDGTVTLNAWNHVWFTEDTQGGHSFELNGVSNTTQNPVYTRSKPGTEAFIVGYTDVTSMGHAGAAFQGKISDINIHDYVVSSTFSTTRTKYIPAVLLLSLDAGDPTSYAAQYTVTVSDVTDSGTKIHIPTAFSANIGNQIIVGYPFTTSWGGGYQGTVTNISTGTGGMGPEWIFTVDTNVSIGFAGGFNITFGNGTAWTDTVSNIAFTLHNTPTYSSDNGGYLTFAPNNSQWADSTASLPVLGKWTVEVWHQYAGTEFGSACIVSEKFTAGFINYAIGTLDQGYLSAGFYNGWHTTPSYGALTVGNWYHIVGSYDGNTVKLYVNGTLATQAVQSNATVLHSGGGINLMRRWDNPDFWGGGLAVVRIYDGALSDAGVLANYNTGKTRYGL